jgi:flagellar basal body-associated protein FliL
MPNMNNIFLKLVLLMVLLASFSLASVADVKSATPQVSPDIQAPTQERSQTSKQQTQQLAKEEASASVIQSFVSDESEKSELVAIQDKTKRLVMFLLGVPLLILLVATAVLGVAMGVYGKQVFVPHMVCAGLSLTLALGHAVVGIVWFYPF